MQPWLYLPEAQPEYNGVRLPDPNPNLSVEEVRNLYATAHPDIATAAIGGPEAVGNKLIGRLTRAEPRARFISLSVASFLTSASRLETC